MSWRLRKASITDWFLENNYLVWIMKSKKLTALYTLAVPTLILGLAAILPGCGSSRPNTNQKATLEVWGVFTDSDVFNPLIGDFNKVYPNVKINYYMKSIQTYEYDLLEAMAAGGGPDILMIHNNWLPKYKNKILPAPADLITFKNVKDEFVDVVMADFVDEGYVYALPLSVDTLALFYNKDIFNTKGIPQPPATWDDFLEDVEKITVRDERGDIKLAGGIIGTAGNINRSTDILSLLMIQSGVQMANKENQEATFNQPITNNNESYPVGERALQFYTDFANPLKPVYTWNDQMDYSIDTFYSGKAATMFGYAYHLPTIRGKAPYLNFDVAPMPQIKGAEFDVNYANYWGLAVSRNTQNAAIAWQFIYWLTQTENAQKYLELTDQPAARRDLINQQQADPNLGVFAKQALTAYSWYQVDDLRIEKSFVNMIESVVNKTMSVKDALDKSADEITSLMRE